MGDLTDVAARGTTLGEILAAAGVRAPQARLPPAEAQPPATPPPAAVGRHVSAPARQAFENDVNGALSPQTRRTAPFA